MTNVTTRSGASAGIALLASFACMAVSAAAEYEQPPVVKEFITAMNGKDANRLGELLSNDFVMPQRDATCDQAQSDRDCQLVRLRALLVANAKLDLGAVKSQREVTRFNVLLTSDAIRATGVSRVSATKEIVIANGKIQSLITTLRTEDPETARYKQRAKI